MKPDYVLTVSKNSLNNFFDEVRDLEIIHSFNAQTELFQKYFKISLRVKNEDQETSLFEETLKNIKRKTQNIVKVEEPAKRKERKRKIKKRARGNVSPGHRRWSNCTKHCQV